MRKIIFYLLAAVCAVLIVYTVKLALAPSEGDSPAPPAEAATPAALPQGFELVTPWEEGRITVKTVGVGDALHGKTMAQRKVWGLTEARKLGYTALAQAIGAIRLNAASTIADERLRDHALDLTLKEFVLGARETEEPEMQRLPDGSERYTVTMQVLVNGETSLNHIIAPLMQRADSKLEEYKAAPAKVAAARKYTGLIIDARGYAISPAMAPKVLLEDGRVVYGVSTVTTDYIQKHGLADYSKSPEKARGLAGRVGDNPLLVKASGARKGVDLLVSPETAAEIRHADALGDFLDKCKVAIIVD